MKLIIVLINIILLLLVVIIMGNISEIVYQVRGADDSIDIPFTSFLLWLSYPILILNLIYLLIFWGDYYVFMQKMSLVCNGLFVAIVGLFYANSIRIKRDVIEYSSDVLNGSANICMYLGLGAFLLGLVNTFLVWKFFKNMETL